MNPSLTPYFLKKSSPNSFDRQRKYFSDIRGSLHIDLLEGGQESVVVLWLFKSLGNSLSESWHGFSDFLSFEWSVYAWGLSWFWSLFGWLGLGWFGFGLLFFLWFRLLFFSLFFFNLLFRLLLFGLSSRFCAFWINIEQWFSDVQTVPSTNVELQKFTSMRALDFNSNLIGLNVGYGLILFDPVSFLWNYYRHLLLTNSVMVPSLIESARNGKLIVLAVIRTKLTCKPEDVLVYQLRIVWTE